MATKPTWSPPNIKATATVTKTERVIVVILWIALIWGVIEVVEWGIADSKKYPNANLHSSKTEIKKPSIEYSSKKIKNEIDKFKIAKKTENYYDAYSTARWIASMYLDNKNKEEYSRWKDISEECYELYKNRKK
jgi:hypothetical protein